MGKDFYKLTVDDKEVSRIFADLPKVTKAATADTINIVTRKVNKNLKTHITTKYNIPKSALKFGDLVRLVRANARTDIGKALIIIKVRGRGLIKYGAKQVDAGVSVAIKKSAKVIKGAYISPLRKRGTDKFVFIKAKGKKAGKVTRYTTKGTPYTADKREILYGPTVADVYTNVSANKVILKTVDDEFQKTLDVQFARQFEKKSR